MIPPEGLAMLRALGATIVSLLMIVAMLIAVAGQPLAWGVVAMGAVWWELAWRRWTA